MKIIFVSFFLVSHIFVLNASEMYVDKSSVKSDKEKLMIEKKDKLLNEAIKEKELIINNRKLDLKMGDPCLIIPSLPVCIK